MNQPEMSLDNQPSASMPEFDISGEWVGDYSQSDRRSPIRATLQQEGQRLSGTMVDLRTSSDRSLFDAVAEAGLPPGTDEQIDEQVRRLLQANDKEPIRARAVLPEQSLLNGQVRGRSVRFTKIYQGQHIVGYQLGDRGIAQVIERHAVEYSGRLAVDGQSIQGQWTIHDPQSPKGLLTGGFVLRRETATPVHET